MGSVGIVLAYSKARLDFAGPQLDSDSEVDVFVRVLETCTENVQRLHSSLKFQSR